MSRTRTIQPDPPENKPSLELIIYQVAEIKSLLKEKNIKDESFQEKVTQYQEKIEKRVSTLEIKEIERAKREKQAEQEQKDTRVDWQKIVFAVIGLASTALAIAYALVQGGVVKP
jgi:hypothetical protein